MKGIYKDVAKKLSSISKIKLGCNHKVKFSTKIKKKLVTYDSKKKIISINMKYFKNLNTFIIDEFCNNCCDMIINNDIIEVTAIGLRGKKNGKN